MGLGSRIEKYLELERPIVWINAIGILSINIAMVYSIAYAIIEKKYAALFFSYLYAYMGAMGVTTGAHRLWTHKTYKAKLPLRIWIMFWYLSSGMYGVVQWVRDHRTHHKYVDTDADPHNFNRGFFFAHCGWLMMKRHPELKEKGKLIDVSDVKADPVVQFAEKYFYPLLVLAHMVVPTCFGHYVLKESWTASFIGMVMARYAFMLHHVWCVNSWAHYNGSKPYNKNITAVNNAIAAFVTYGEGWHNFHHTFPWDYRIGEYGQGQQYGTKLIELYAWLGLAYDLKSASVEIVQKVLANNGELGMEEILPEYDYYCNDAKDEAKVANEKVNASEEVDAPNGKVKAS